MREVILIDNMNEIPEDYKYDTETNDFWVYRHKYTGHEIHIARDPLYVQTIPEVINALKTLEPQLSEDCNFCSEHEQGDTLYEMSSWDGGIGYDYIRPIKYCPMCGRKLKEEEE